MVEPDIICIANDEAHNIRDYAVFDPITMHTGIIRPEITTAQFEFKPMMFQMLQAIVKYSRSVNEDPHLHLRQFLESNTEIQLNKPQAKQHTQAPQVPPSYSAQNYPSNQGNNQLENILKSFIQEEKTQFQTPGESIKNLENQVRRIATALSSRNKGTLPSSTESSATTSGNNQLENILKSFIQEAKTKFQTQGESIKNLENQVGQIATALSSRNKGTLPSSTESSATTSEAKSIETCKVIKLRNGKECEGSTSQ
ncbi:hypothetical protein KIW84_010811 [Lathyrus oleraceus]|uniref:Uncharacterized protein n=1 Tax=Pisum sativum TaxID=3888 RepID=A0A9D4YKX8_PEA|nr:hypothetical protein KIW84_010811 [Pisum sativum]